MICLSFSKITSEPMGALQLFENLIQAKHLHSPSNWNSLIQVNAADRKCGAGATVG